MRSLSPRSIAIVSSLVVVGLLLLFLFLFDLFGLVELSMLNLAVVVVFTFAICSIIFHWFLQRYLVKRIEKVKQTVRTFRETNRDKQEEKLPDPVVTDDIVIDLYREILGWSDDRKDELERLHKLEQYRREFLGNVSHELKTPIFNIQGYISTLLEGGLDDPTINKSFLERAEKGVDRMIGMIGDLEAITQLETGQLELDIERFDIVALVKEVFEAEEMKATNKGIMLRLKESSETPCFVQADKFRIRQVITNLIVNSINYGKEYGETMVRFYRNRDAIVVEISDNGPGIAPEHLKRLFERFYRVDKGRSRAQGGTGLGLSIVKHIIEAHGQTINVTSKLNKGTTFSFTLQSDKSS